MLPFSDLELSPHCLDGTSYQVDFRFSQSNSAYDEMQHSN